MTTAQAGERVNKATLELLKREYLRGYIDSGKLKKYDLDTLNSIYRRYKKANPHRFKNKLT